MDSTKFWAIISKVQTLKTDNTIRVTLDLPESAIAEMAELVAYQVHGVVLDVECMPRVQEENESDKHRTDRKLHI